MPGLHVPASDSKFRKLVTTISQAFMRGQFTPQSDLKAIYKIVSWFEWQRWMIYSEGSKGSKHIQI